MTWWCHDWDTISTLGWPFVQENPLVTGGFHNEQYCEAFMFSLLLDWGWTNIPVAGDLRRHDTHVMSYNKPLPEQLLAKITAASKSLEDNELTST